MKIMDSIFCLFMGHQYCRFERRNQACLHCGKRKESKSRFDFDSVDRRHLTIGETSHQDIELSGSHVV